MNMHTFFFLHIQNVTARHKRCSTSQWCVCALEASGFDITPVPAEYGTTVAFQIICDVTNQCQTLHTHHSTQWSSDIQLWEEEEEPIGDWMRTFRFAVLRCLTVFLLSIRLL